MAWDQSWTASSLCLPSTINQAGVKSNIQSQNSKQNRTFKLFVYVCTILNTLEHIWSLAYTWGAIFWYGFWFCNSQLTYLSFFYLIGLPISSSINRPTSQSPQNTSMDWKFIIKWCSLISLMTEYIVKKNKSVFLFYNMKT
jgi:hypothetical protein